MKEKAKEFIENIERILESKNDQSIEVIFETLLFSYVEVGKIIVNKFKKIKPSNLKNRLALLLIDLNFIDYQDIIVKEIIKYSKDNYDIGSLIYSIKEIISEKNLLLLINNIENINENNFEGRVMMKLLITKNKSKLSNLDYRKSLKILINI